MQLTQSFVPLDKRIHDVKGFDCGKANMNEFLRRFADKHAKLGLSKTWVLPFAPERQESETQSTLKSGLAAYYTLAVSSVSRNEIPVSGSLPRYPVPIVLLARLAVDVQCQGRRVGEKALVYALRHIVRLCDQGLPALGVVLDVLDDDALKFYQRFEFFHPFTDDPMRLFVPMSALRKR